jgi:hypothetical protein
LAGPRGRHPDPIVNVPRLLGKVHWEDSFTRRVRAGEVEGVTFEGVVGKGMRGRKLVMAKAKTQAWIDAVVTRFGKEEGMKIVTS